MKRKIMYAILTITCFLTLTACGAKTEKENSGDESAMATGAEETEEANEDEDKGLPYKAEIIYPDASFEVMDEAAFKAAIKADKDNKFASMFPYMTITNISDDVYAITADYMGNEIIRDLYFEPGEVLYLSPVAVKHEDATYTWGIPQILTFSADPYNDIVHLSTTVTNTEENFYNTYGDYDIMKLTIPAITNQSVEEFPLHRIFYYDAMDNLIATDGCNYTCVNSSYNDYAEERFPTILAPQQLDWDHAVVHYSYRIANYSAG